MRIAFPLIAALVSGLMVSINALEYGCKKCPENQACPQLPVNCEVARAPCGCCDVCAGKLNEPCSALAVRCASGLMCVNGRGEALKHVPWFMTNYKGTCQDVVVNPVVIENTEIEERRYSRYK